MSDGKRKNEGQANEAEATEAEATEAETAAAATPEIAEGLQAEIARLTDQWKRALAEIENMRRRAEREREEIAKYAIAGFARDLLAVADNLRRALENIPAAAREGDELLNTLAVGVEATERELLAVFERHGLRRIEPLGEAFDHNFHQAIAEIEGSGKPAGTIVQLLRPGYVLNGRLLRPAMVAVAKDEEEGGEEAPQVDTTA